MGYEVIPVDITRYVMTVKEIAKFFNKGKSDIHMQHVCHCLVK